MPNITDFDYPVPTNITRVEDLFTHANSLTNDMFGVGLLLLIWVVAFTGFKGYYNSESAFASASFITAISSVILFGLEIVSATYLTITILLLVIAVFLFGRKK
jgi:hypothetical protein